MNRIGMRQRLMSRLLSDVVNYEGQCFGEAIKGNGLTI
jgi:hypothetical protein